MPVISLTNINKTYTIRKINYGIKNSILHFWSQVSARIRPEFHSVLKNINFTVNAGEAVGITGANGSGKTTLLGLIAGVIQPDSGEIKKRGKMGMMLELGAGFCSELSGRENIYINGILQGARYKEVKKLEAEIIDFSGIEEYIDSPMFTYSSGMQARLGFAISIVMSPDILLVDEVLAVGDVEFRDKCLKRVQKLLTQGSTLLLVSHNPVEIARFCSRVIKIENGIIINDSTTGDNKIA